MITVTLQYRDAHNFKNQFDIQVDPDEWPHASTLLQQEHIEMGQLGSPTQKEFFGSDLHPEPYDMDRDHNLLEVLKLTVTDDPAGSIRDQYAAVKRDLELNDTQVAQMFGYSTVHSFRNSARYLKVISGIVEICQRARSEAALQA